VPQGFQGFTNQKIYSKKAKNLWQKQEKLQRKSKKTTAKKQKIYSEKLWKVLLCRRHFYVGVHQ